MSKDYRAKSNEVFAEQYGKPKGELVWSATVEIQPTDISILDPLGRVRPGGYRLGPNGMLELEFRFVRLKPFDPFEFVKRIHEKEEEFQARSNKPPEFAPYETVWCTASFVDLIRGCKKIDFSAYTDGTFIIEQWDAHDIEFRRELAKLARP